MTTPESIEAMLVSSTLDPRVLLANVRVVIVDEVHAFAGDDRGWHLLAVLERLTHLTGRSIQRIGLSATVGNAPSLLEWLRGSNARPGEGGHVIAPPSESSVTPDVALDYVGSIERSEGHLTSAPGREASGLRRLETHCGTARGEVERLVRRHLRLPLESLRIGTSSVGDRVR